MELGSSISARKTELTIDAFVAETSGVRRDSNLQPMSTRASFIPARRITTKEASKDVVVEGYLKKIRALLQRNKRAYFKVIGTNMYVATDKEPKDGFEHKYDLTNYTLSLSKKEKKQFYFTPIDEKLKLQVLRFIAKDAEERAFWYKQLQLVMKSDETDPLRSFTSALPTNFYDFEMPRSFTTVERPRQRLSSHGQLNLG